MSTLFGKAALSAVTMAVGSLSLAPAEALALGERCEEQTYTLAASGSTATQYTLDNGVTWAAASSVSPWAGWSVIPGTTYINYRSDYSGLAQTWAHYETGFTVPALSSGWSLDSHQLVVEYYADNAAQVFVDGDNVASQPVAELMSNFQGTPGTYTANVLDYGPHTLAFNVFNFDGPTGLDFKVTYQRRICQPCIRGPGQLNCPAL